VFDKKVMRIEYSLLRRRKWREGGEDYTNRSFITCTLSWVIN
jgi:hypothetical protein